MTDHRIQMTEMGMDAMMSGAMLERFSDALQTAHTREQLELVLESKT